MKIPDSLLHQLMIGEKLGPYTILEIVGNGSLGTVYRDEAPTVRLVALKLVRFQVLITLERREQFLGSALASGEIRHQGTCPNEILNVIR